MRPNRLGEMKVVLEDVYVRPLAFDWHRFPGPGAFDKDFLLIKLLGMCFS